MSPRENQTHDRLPKLIPIIKNLALKFQTVPMSLSRHHLKQYMPTEPQKWGYKLFVRCWASGFSYNFEIYISSEIQSNFRLPVEPGLKAASNTEILSLVYPECFQIIWNIWSTLIINISLPLMSFLISKGRFALGTGNRVPNCKLPSEKN